LAGPRQQLSLQWPQQQRTLQEIPDRQAIKEANSNLQAARDGNNYLQWS